MKRHWEIDEVISVISHHYPTAQALYLFGSHASNQAWPTSDVDLAILLPHNHPPSKLPPALSDCAAQLSLVTHAEVDLIHLRETETILQKEVIHNGQRIWTRDQSAAEHFEMEVLKNYQLLQRERREIVTQGLQGERLYQP